jgi:uronate dehydrogenase
VIATDIAADPEAGIQTLDVQDFAALRSALAGVDTVVHLAWYMKSDQFHEQIVPVNVVGTYNVYEAARLNNVRRVIFGSSNHG